MTGNNVNGICLVYMLYDLPSARHLIRFTDQETFRLVKNDFLNKT